MSTTKSISKVTFADDTIEVPFLARTNLVRVSDEVETRNNGNIEHTVRYVLATGDDSEQFVITVALRQTPSNNGGLGSHAFVMRVETIAKEVDDTTGETIWSAPVTATTTINLPGLSGVIDVADFADLLGILYTVWFNGVDGANVPTTTVIDRLRFGNLDIS